MLADGFTLLLIGMGSVFAFLTLLVFAMQFATMFFRNFPDDQEKESPLERQMDHHTEIAIAIAAAKSMQP